MDWKSQLDDTSGAIAAFRRTRPEAGQGFTTLYRAAMAEGSMTVREKELVALGIGIAQRCADCIGFHLRAAVRAGATRDDVADTISVAIMMGGGPAYMYGAKALQAYDQLIGEG